VKKPIYYNLNNYYGGGLWMFSRVNKELLRNKERNEIFYSLSKSDLYGIYTKLNSSTHPEYLDVIVEIKAEEIDKIFKLLSTTYSLPNKEEIVASVWETYICNKILEALYKKTASNTNMDELVEEKNILMSFKLNKYLNRFENRTTIKKVNDIATDCTNKKVRVHYFPSDIMVPIDLQKALNHVFYTSISFTNMLYTCTGSLNSQYKSTGKWLKEIADGYELWQTDTSSIEEKNAMELKYD